jgi:3-oxoacyl-[acyl-carrier-protein] synthase-3
MTKAKITGTGMAVPEKVVPNKWFNEQLGEDVDSWLRENVQIYERRWLEANQGVADLCEAAAWEALANAGLNADQIDLLIVATDTPEFISPSTASILQDRLKATNAASFDLNTACAGFVSALDTAFKYLGSDDRYKRALVIGAYGMSKYLDLKDKKTVTLFADGAGAAILDATATGSAGQLSAYQITQGQYNEWMGIYAGATKQPTTQEVVAKGDHKLKFVKRFPSELNPNMWSEIASRLCKEAAVELDEVKMFFMTQININSIWAMLDILKLPHDRAITIMHKYGYTGSAAIPMALHLAVKQDRIKRGDKIILIGSGGGLSFAGSLLEF